MSRLTDPARLPLPPDPLAPRASLVARLRGDARLSVVRGPLGSGKTVLATLAAREDAAAGRVVVWREVHADDDAEQTWAAVLADLTGDGAEPTDAAGAAGGPRDALARLTVALRAGEPPVTIVLDSLDRARDPRLASDVLELVTSVAGLRVIVTTRRALQLEGRSARVRVPVALVGPDLALTAEDIAVLLPDRTPSPETTRRLALHTGGHALTMRLLLLALADHGQHPGAVPPERLRALADEAALEVLGNAATPAELAMLSRLAVPGHLTVELADLVRALRPPAADDGEDAGAAERLDRSGRDLIDHAEELGLGFWRTGGLAATGPDLFEVLAPFRAVLHTHLRTNDPDLHARLTHDVVAAALATGAFGVAGLAALEAQDPALLDRACRAGWLYLRDADMVALSDIALGVEEWQLEGYPSLALTLGFALRQHPTRGHLAPRMFDVAARSVALLNPSDPGERCYLSTVKSMALRFLGDHARAQEAATTALDSLREARAAGIEVQGAGFLLRNIATASFISGDTPRALELLEEAHANERPGTPSELLTRLLRALVLVWAGEVEIADTFVRDLPTRPPDVLALGRYAARILLDTRAIIAMERDDREGYDEAQDLLLAIPQRFEELAGLEAISLATRAAYAGELTEAQAVLDRALMAPNARLVSVTWVERIRAVRTMVRAALGGPLSAAGAPVEMLGESTADHDTFALLLRAAALVATGHLSLADTLMLEAARPRPPATAADGPVLHSQVALRILTHLLDAVLATRTGNRDAARRQVGSAVALTRESGSRRMWLALTAADRRLLEGLLPGGAPDNLDTPFPAMLEAGATTSTDLTPRETIVLHELARGSSTRATADVLGVSVNTVKSQQRSLYRKLGASTREEALRRARDLELL
ncbi:ATP/maltotriose-dependent transcriptional regulator MalT [Salana multivorans]|uniref:ATP/maltotriose-dependent transcriptional regulator MalT n=1 Tax=Salana multivorans TaxID=120377 RepID=A0A3N2DAS3_9MICO|nr:LuxR C-terminal-related transcriptional regulator [Salana multivorans]ROR96856.1 ATP/maltotriose-dependent transcriptional regulator MalT [Salana multivorans]